MRTARVNGGPGREVLVFQYVRSGTEEIERAADRGLYRRAAVFRGAAVWSAARLDHQGVPGAVTVRTEPGMDWKDWVLLAVLLSALVYVFFRPLRP